MKPIIYEVQGRNGYWAIDEYEGDRCMRLFDTFKTRKQAQSVTSELNRLAKRINELEGRTND